MPDSKKMFLEVLFYALMYVGVLAIVLAVASPLFWLKASQEAAVFNRFTTGPKATAWDALWVEFRVEAER
jgi:hypothetical protein